MTYLTAVLLDFVQHLVEIFIELFQLQQRGGVPLLEVEVDEHRIRLLQGGSTSSALAGTRRQYQKSLE